MGMLEMKSVCLGSGKWRQGVESKVVRSSGNKDNTGPVPEWPVAILDGNRPLILSCVTPLLLEQDKTTQGRVDPLMDSAATPDA